MYLLWFSAFHWMEKKERKGGRKGGRKKEGRKEKKEKDNLRAGGTQTRLYIFRIMERNLVIKNCYWRGSWRETDVSMSLAHMNSKEVSSEAKFTTLAFWKCSSFITSQYQVYICPPYLSFPAPPKKNYFGSSCFFAFLFEF